MMSPPQKKLAIHEKRGEKISNLDREPAPFDYEHAKETVMNLDGVVIVNFSVKVPQKTENILLKLNNLAQEDHCSETSSGMVKMLTEAPEDMGCLQSDELSKKRNIKRNLRQKLKSGLKCPTKISTNVDNDTKSRNPPCLIWNKISTTK